MTDTGTFRGDPRTEEERRRAAESDSRVLAGVQVREDDVEPAKGLHSVAILFRLMAGLLVLLMVLQVFFGLTSTVAISYGVLFAEAVRLIIFAGLLWAAGDLADLYVKSHHDLRATRILVARLAHSVREMEARSGTAATGERR